MDAVTVLRQEMEQVHGGLMRELEGLSFQHLIYRPAPDASTIAFVSWHILRTLDDAAHMVVPKESRPNLWEHAGWRERFGFSEEQTGTGTGFTAEQVGQLRPSLALLTEYAEAVLATIAPAFEGLTEADLDQVTDPERPRLTLARRLQVFIVGHTYSHLGDVRFLKGLQGMPFPL